MTSDGIRLLYEHIGDKALAYLLVVESDQLQAHLADPSASSLGDLKDELLSQLVIIDNQIREWSPVDDTAGEWANRLANYPDNGIEESLGNYIRRLSGGIVETVPETLGEIEHVMAQLAVEIYPGLLVRESNELYYRRIGLPVTLFRHPLNNVFQELAVADKDFSKLFTTDSESGGKGGSTLRSTGHGGGHQLWTMAETFLNSGWTLACLTSDSPSVAEFIDGVLRSMQTIRLAINKKKTDVPVRFGLTGVLLPEGIDTVELGWATLRRPDSRDGRFVKTTALEGQLSGTNEDGDTTTINYSGDIVVEMRVPYAMRIGEHNLRLGWPDAMLSSVHAVEQAVENLRLGLLLADAKRRRVIHTSWIAIIDPFSQAHHAGWNDISRAVNLMPTQLTESDTQSWKDQAKLIGTHRVPTIGVAIRRMLASVAERRSPEDILVDAVIVWENLFGARTETTLRVTSSLAWLLGSSPEDRKAKQKIYKDIYNFRSRVVHGESKVDQAKLQQYAMDAVDISVGALSEIFNTRPDLLKIGKSEDRSIEIMHSGTEKSPERKIGGRVRTKATEKSK